MKKIIFVLLVLSMLVTSTTFASCELDTTRWKWIGSDDKNGLFYDTHSVRFINSYLVEFWGCIYHPYGCDIYNNEHYHYWLNRINYDNNTFGQKSYVDRSANGRVLDSYTWYNIRFNPIVPHSLAEGFADGIREDYKL